MTQRICFVCTLVLIIAGKSHPQTPVSKYRARTAMAQCRTVTALQKAHDKAGAHDKVTELVFFSRWLALSPRSQVAVRGLLKNIPSTEEEAEDLMTLPGPPEEISASESDMLALVKIYSRWPKLVADAVISAPDGMQDYVAYLPLATFDAHSNFTGNAQRVCTRFPKKFRSALAGLSQKDRDYVRDKVFDSDHCRAIFVSGHQASSTRKSLTLFPVGPVWTASPSFSNSGNELNPLKCAPTSSPAFCARSRVVPSATAPAAGLVPSIPSVPALSAAMFSPAIFCAQ